MKTFDSMESNVRSYIRAFPTVFDHAKGALICDEDGNEYIDFLAGAGALNYGHNNDVVTTAFINYLQKNGVVHSLDKATKAKQSFLESFSRHILVPRGLDYKIQFTGPTGTNAVEAALKLARIVTGREGVIAFTNGYHGLTLGALATTGNGFYHKGLTGTRANVSRMPFDGYLGDGVNTIHYLEKMLDDPGSGVDLPAAVILETVQCEGGVKVAGNGWLQDLVWVCKARDILLIVDDIQVGNGRAGEFFSFEAAGITPDMICLSKSIGGGLPMSILLLSPEVDQWLPGQHTGTFRGNNLAFVAATAIIETYWQNDELSYIVKQKGEMIQTALTSLATQHADLGLAVRGRGMIWGLDIPHEGMARLVSQYAFKHNLIVETCGSQGRVVKLLPPLTIDPGLLEQGLQTLIEGVNGAVTQQIN